MSLSPERKAHRLAGLVYLLYLLGFLFGITAVIGIIINHTHLEKTRNTVAYSHFIWQILAFWILFGGIVVSILSWPGGFSSLVALICLLWWIASALTGVWLLLQNKPIRILDAPATTANSPQ